MNKAIFLIVFLLVGCTTKEIIYHNQTTIKIINYTTIKCPDCICNCNQTNEPECEVTTIVIDNCSNKLNLCHLRLDFMNDNLFDCLMTNGTQYSENLTIKLNDCQEELNITQIKLDKIESILE